MDGSMVRLMFGWMDRRMFRQVFCIWLDFLDQWMDRWMGG
jgi:hypothetical protein